MTEPRKAVRVLIIDEHDGYFALLEQYADMCGHEYDFACKFAGNTDEALSTMKEWEPSVILIDAHLPDMNSFDLLAQCTSGGAPVIVTSDHKSREIENTARERGASGYLAKTDNPDELENLIHRLADISPAEGERH